MKIYKDVIGSLLLSSLIISPITFASTSLQYSENSRRTVEVTMPNGVESHLKQIDLNTNRNQSWIVELNSPSVFAERLRLTKHQKISGQLTPSKAINEGLTSYEFSIRSEQDEVESQLMSSGLVRHIQGKRSLLVNMLVVQATEENVDAIRALPGVKRVVPNRTYSPIYSTREVKTVNEKTTQSASHSEASNTGAGVKIAILDTGIDYTHVNLGGCFGLGCKVVGGYDVYNDDSDPLESDDDPFYAFLGHGTHVAGIAAGARTASGEGQDGVKYVVNYCVVLQIFLLALKWQATLMETLVLMMRLILSISAWEVVSVLQMISFRKLLTRFLLQGLLWLWVLEMMVALAILEILPPPKKQSL